MMFMFGLMKMLRKEHYSTDERLSLSDLHVGCTVGFGFMPQRNISGCRLPVKAVHTYNFGEDSFLTYVLDNDEKDINLIVTTDEHLKETHLSLSQRIDDAVFANLFPSHEPASWFALKPGEKVSTSDRVMGMQQSWISGNYRVVMQARGSVTEGDNRLLKRAFGGTITRQFDYVILVDDTNEHALEAEKYDDGSLVVYSTVYRPVTDIGEISGPIHSAARLAHMDHVLEKLAPTQTPEKEDGNVIAMIPTPVTVRKEEQEKAAPDASRDMLALDAKLAAGIIQEAQKNRISLAALIRKVIDLPEIINDQVMVSFSLSDAEYTELSERYHLEHSDHAGVRDNIIKELRQFVGNKKSR